MFIQKKQLDSVQALRALAVVLVVYYHSILSSETVFGHSFQTDFYYLKNWGSIGVDLFFVISGFIMTRVIKSYTRPNSWSSFLTKRAIRIIPLYWGLTIIAVLLKVLLKTHVDFLELGKAFSFFPIFDKDTFILPIINCGWTLSLEVYFYTIIGLFLAVNPKKLLRTLTITLCLFSLMGVLDIYNSALLRFALSPLLLEFLMGILCGILYDRVDVTSSYMPRLAQALCVSGTLLMIGSIFWMNKDLGPVTVLNNNQAALIRSLTLGTPSAMLLAGCVLLEKCNSIQVPRFAKLVGDASYSNYLIHQFIINGSTLYISRIMSATFSVNPTVYSLLLTFTCSLLSLFVYKNVEKSVTIFISGLTFSGDNYFVKLLPRFRT